MADILLYKTKFVIKTCHLLKFLGTINAQIDQRRTSQPKFVEIL